VIAKFFVNVVRAGEASADGFEARLTTFNGAPGLLLVVKGHPVTALSLDVQDGKIHAIFAHRNPDKLRLFEEQAGERKHTEESPQ
jgi:RNA polymerase sigma-70 factor (ECF subfamily)